MANARHHGKRVQEEQGLIHTRSSRSWFIPAGGKSWPECKGLGERALLSLTFTPAMPFTQSCWCICCVSLRCQSLFLHLTCQELQICWIQVDVVGHCTENTQWWPRHDLVSTQSSRIGASCLCLAMSLKTECAAAVAAEFQTFPWTGTKIMKSKQGECSLEGTFLPYISFPSYRCCDWDYRFELLLLWTKTSVSGMAKPSPWQGYVEESGHCRLLLWAHTKPGSSAISSSHTYGKFRVTLQRVFPLESSHSLIFRCRPFSSL